MLSVPLTWHDQTIGVLNVQTEHPRVFSPRTSAQLSAVADLLAGIVEKGRQQSEAEARVESLKAIDEARSELIALVTHELRTPLAVVRAYTDLLAEEPKLDGRRVARRRAPADARRVARRDARADRAPGPAGRLDPRLGPGRARGCRRRRAGRCRGARRRGAPVAETVARPTPRRHRRDAAAPRPGRSVPPPPDRRAPRRERGQVRPVRHDDPDRLGARRGPSSTSA